MENVLYSFTFQFNMDLCETKTHNKKDLISVVRLDKAWSLFPEDVIRFLEFIKIYRESCICWMEQTENLRHIRFSGGSSQSRASKVMVHQSVKIGWILCVGTIAI